ncbi:30S ribosomal protein S8 [Geodia barretti]|uniref:30S ribosomal protein S8 n=1 Tax=Geodia barretti TaxID=519541 RepID=A0AA35RI00_GEOBA|nr:30S ribosomal protein S8 [Geodia barretti]
MLTRIRNAIQARHQTVLVPQSKVKIAIADILKAQGYIREWDQARNQKFPTMRIQLTYKLKRVSKPGLRVHVGRGEIPRVYGGLGIAIVSTSQGMMTGYEAWRKGIGGELVCYVW